MCMEMCQCACAGTLTHSGLRGTSVERDFDTPSEEDIFLALHLIHSSLSVYLSSTYSVLPLLSIVCMSIYLVLKQGYAEVLSGMS